MTDGDEILSDTEIRRIREEITLSIPGIWRQERETSLDRLIASHKAQAKQLHEVKELLRKWWRNAPDDGANYMCKVSGAVGFEPVTEQHHDACDDGECDCAESA